jgi:hypothetical protein
MLLVHIGKKIAFPSALPVPVKKASSSSSSSSTAASAGASASAGGKKKAPVEAVSLSPHGKRPETTSATKVCFSLIIFIFFHPQ